MKGLKQLLLGIALIISGSILMVNYTDSALFRFFQNPYQMYSVIILVVFFFPGIGLAILGLTNKE